MLCGLLAGGTPAPQSAEVYCDFTSLRELKGDCSEPVLEWTPYAATFWQV